MHRAANAIGLDNILEVSSKSDKSLGEALSAFNLSVDVPGHGQVKLESAFQGSKVFKQFGHCRDLYECDPRDAKGKAKSRDRNDLQGFKFAGTQWGLEPKTSFYDWLYLQALSNVPRDDLQDLKRFGAFTDIEFNPAKSFNCQARSCALAVSLMHIGKFWASVHSEKLYRELILKEIGSNSDHESELGAQQRLL